MIEKVVHLSDIHIRKALSRHLEYREALKNAIDLIKEHNPDRIVIVGDLYHDFIDIEGEALVLATWFLKELSNICKVIITRGNHDFMKKNKKRYDVIKTITEMIKDPNIIYYDETGFYEDDNLVWAVWHHPDKQGPWNTIQHDRLNKIYVDLFHDPVKSCITPLGWPMDKGVSITTSDFKGDLGMFGDIHLQQNIGRDTIAYAGSLIQQSFDEKIYGHGFLVWSISNKNYQFIEVPSNFKHIEIVLSGEINYDALNILIPETFPNMYFKVKWTDTRNNMHKVNQSKIREALKDYNPLDIKWDKTVLKRGEMEVDDSIRKNINDPEVQRKVFKEYLAESGYEDNIIEQVLEIDKKITDRLPNKESKFNDYQIESIWLDNFKSYGDDILINWTDCDGIIQITGENQVGKTTLLDCICYVLFGKTLSTLKKQKHGDNRFINNKRNLNHCSAWIVLNLNDKRYLLKRTTLRKMHASENRVTSVTTEYHIYDLVDLSVEDINSKTISDLSVNDALTGERYLDTQKEIETCIGTFEDFIKVVLINADNLNDLLSIDRAEFIDSVMRYAGYTIFEEKLEEFKEFKKEESKKIDRINIDLNIENDKIDVLIKDISNINLDITEYDIKLEKSKKEHDKESNAKEELLRKLIKINDEIVNFDIKDAEEKIIENNNIIKSKESEIEKIKRDINSLSSKEEIENAKNKIDTFESELEQIRTDKENIKDKMSKLESNKKDKDSEILLEESSKENKIDQIKNETKLKIKDLEFSISTLEKDLAIILKDAKEIKDKIKDLEESKICSQCGQDLKEEALLKIKESIDINKKNLEKLKEKHVVQNSDLDVLKNNKIKLDQELLNIEKNDDVIYLINESSSKIDSIKLEIEKILENAKSLKSDIVEKDRLIEAKKTTISNLKVILKDESKKVELESSINDLNLKIGDLKLGIKTVESNKLLYEQNLDSIVFNIDINEKVLLKNEELKNLVIKQETLNKDLNILNTNKALKEEEIINKRNKIDKYTEQVKVDMIYDIYQKCVHRDGLPTMLLKRSIDVINDEMSAILQDQDYISYFDEELNLMLSHLNKLSANQNAIESSGKERTFIALALKLALRSINNTSRPNFILLDEMMGKLINDSVDQFFQVLDRIKETIQKIVIIEHIHPINYDYRIHAEKDENGISKCNLV